MDERYEESHSHEGLDDVELLADDDSIELLPDVPEPLSSCDDDHTHRYTPHHGDTLRGPDLAAVLLFLVFVLSVVFAVFTLGTTSTDVNPGDHLESRTQSLFGRALDLEGRPVEDVTVTLRFDGTGSRRMTTTDMGGWYFLDYLLEGHYVLTSSQTGYKSCQRDVWINPAMVRNADITMSPGTGILHENSTGELEFPDRSGSEYTLAVVSVLLGGCAIGSAALAITRQGFLVCLALAATSALSFGFLLGTILAFGACILLLWSRDQFPRSNRIIPETLIGRFPLTR